MLFAGLMNDPTLPSMAVLALLGGLLALDDTAWGQTWVALPLPAGILTGYLCGEPAVGLAVALPLQIILAGNLPVGQTYVGDATSAVIAAVAATAWRPEFLAGKPPAGLPLSLDLLGWVMLGAALLSLAGSGLIQLERKAHGLWMQEGHRTLRDGSLARIERLHRRCLQATFLRGGIVTVLFALVLSRFWLPLLTDLPAQVRLAMGLLPILLPAVGVGTLVDRYGLRSGWIWITAGACAGFAVTSYLS